MRAESQRDQVLKERKRERKSDRHITQISITRCSNRNDVDKVRDRLFRK